MDVGQPGSAPGTAPAQPYTDQLIDPDSPASIEARDEAEAVAERQTPGLEATSVEARGYHYGSSPGGSMTETGIAFQHRRETLNHGDWLLEGSALLSSSGTGTVFGGTDARRRLRVQLRQQAMPLAGDLAWSNAIGVIRLPPPAGGDYLSRFQLPGALVAGASTALESSRSAIHVGVGEAARLDGGQGLGWSSTGRLALGAGWNWRNEAGLRASIDLSHLARDPGTSASGQPAGIGGDGLAAAFTVGGRDRPPPGVDASTPRWRWQYRLLAGEGGRLGHSADARWREGLGVWSGSAWRFDPGLSWYGNLLSSGQYGVALRHDHADPSQFWGLGADWARDRAWVEGAPSLENRALSASIGVKTALGRSVGVATQWREIAPRGAGGQGGAATGVTGDGATLAYRVTRQSITANYSRGIRDYADRWQVSWIGNRSAADASDLVELEWSADLTLDARASLGGFAGVGLQRDADGTRRWRPTAGANWAVEPAERWTVHSYLRYSRDVTNDLQSYAWAGGVRVGYRIDRRWRISVDGGLNQGSVTANPAEPLFATVQTTRQRDRSIWLTLGYQDAGGVPYATLTGSTRRGAGRIEGIVFQDENGDGVRQPGERPVANVSLRLDNGLVARTDATGRFSFPIAGPGSRRVLVDAETVRLPWGVASDTPVSVEVRVRETVSLDIALTKIGE
ncbi:MAG: hypothetical protein AB7P21_01635 [Lautropia sp.]